MATTEYAAKELRLISRRLLAAERLEHAKKFGSPHMARRYRKMVDNLRRQNAPIGRLLCAEMHFLGFNSIYGPAIDDVCARAARRPAQFTKLTETPLGLLVEDAMEIAA